MLAPSASMTTWGIGADRGQCLADRALALRLELHRDAVHAIAFAGRLRAVLGDVAEMAAAAAAMHFGARIDELVIGRRPHRAVERRPEARPTGAAVVLGVRREQLLVAAGANVDTGIVALVERARTGALGDVAAQHGVLLLAQALAPFGVAQVYLVGFVALGQRRLP